LGGKNKWGEEKKNGKSRNPSGAHGGGGKKRKLGPDLCQEETEVGKEIERTLPSVTKREDTRPV